MTSSAKPNSPIKQPSSKNRSLQMREWRLILTLVDLIAINGALMIWLSIRPDYELTWVFSSRWRWFLILSIVWLFAAHAFDAYNISLVQKYANSAFSIIKAGVVTTGLFLLVPYLSPVLPARRSLVFVFPLLALALLLIGRGVFALLTRRAVFRQRTLIIGAGWAGQTIAQTLKEDGGEMYRVMGFIDDDLSPKLDHLAHPINEYGPILGNRHELNALINEYGVTTLVQAITQPLDAKMLEILTNTLELGVEIMPMPVLYEQLTGRVPIEHVGGNWYVAMPIRHPGTSTLWPIVNRIFDIVSASMGLFLLGIAFPFLAVALYLDSPGPIFYTQERVGRGGKTFRVYKFRSMVVDAEKTGAVWATKNDDRITRVGKLLRKTHVDEFPQFINIIKGEMSAVGPRPERPEFVEELAQEIPFYRVRHAVKPGMAGWGLVKQGYGASKEDALLKLQYDLYYIKHQSLWLDVIILMKTILDTISLGGR